MWLKPCLSIPILTRQLKLTAIEMTFNQFIAVHFSERICELQIFNWF